MVSVSEFTSCRNFVVFLLLLLIRYARTEGPASVDSPESMFRFRANTHNMSNETKFEFSTHGDNVDFNPYRNSTKISCNGFRDNKVFANLNGSYSELKRLFGGRKCNHIDGSLYISDIKLTDGSLDFLDSVEQISGSLSIAFLETSELILPNLRIIRGEDYFHYKSLKLSLYMFGNHKISHFSLPKLQSILRHNVLFLNTTTNLCYAPYTVNWQDIMEDPINQKVHIIGPSGCRPLNSGARPGMPKVLGQCSQECPQYKGGNRYCWSGNVKDCQTPHKCQTRECGGPNHCNKLQDNREECCSEQCSVGCFGFGNSNCMSCRNFKSDEVCVNMCPPRKIYDPHTSKYKINPDFRFILGGKECVTKCPDNFVIEGDTCVSKCSESRLVVKDGVCVPCLNCETTCTWDDVEPNKEVHYVSESSIQRLSNCSIFKGNLKFTGFSFKGDSFLKIPALKPEDLINLGNLKSIEGDLIMTSDVSWLKNLSFFQKLRHVSSITIAHNHGLETIAFPQLELPTGKITVFMNSKLCYAPNENGSNNIINMGNSVNCSNANAKCDEQCDSLGCWGAGPSQCLKCKLFVTSERTCVANCTRHPGFTDPLPDAPLKVSSLCRECHSECVPSDQGTCRATGADQCLQGCRNVKDGPFCVPHCPSIKFADRSTKKCQECSQQCLLDAKLYDGGFSESETSFCSGPEPFPGVQGCHMCRRVVLDPITYNISHCVNATQPCPTGTYDQIIIRSHPFQFPFASVFLDHPSSGPQLRSWILNHTQSLWDLVRVCLPCHPHCLTCKGYSTDQCSLCQYARQEEHCVASCPYKFLPISSGEEENTTWHNVTDLLFSTNTSSPASCCHSQCRTSCSGPLLTDCDFCQNFRDHDLEEPNKWTCVSMCPLSRPYSFLDSTSGDHVCSVSPLSSAVITVLIILSILVLVVFALLYRRFTLKRRRRKLRYSIGPRMLALQEMGRYLQEDRQHMLSPSVPPNMNQLLIIPEAHLTRGSVVGSGAFGTVYRGVWTTDWGTLARHHESPPPNVSSDTKVEIPVAVKVLSDTSDPNTNRELLEETQVMASVDHSCCLRVLGLCLTVRPQLVTQFMPLGCVLDYVRTHRPTLRSDRLLTWSTQIASGMAYLESRGIIHRDLAARNVLVQNPRQIAITDFGLAKFLDTNEAEYRAKGGRMPIKWLAIESIHHRIFSHKSDVWAYGVTLWEIFSMGQRPYPKIPAPDLLEHLEGGERLPQPPICTLEVYMILVQCWLADPESRPSFGDLVDKFTAMNEDPNRYLVLQNDTSMRYPSSRLTSQSSSTLDNSMTSCVTDTTWCPEEDTGQLDQYLQLLDWMENPQAQLDSYAIDRYTQLTIPSDFLHRRTIGIPACSPAVNLYEEEFSFFQERKPVLDEAQYVAPGQSRREGSLSPDLGLCRMQHEDTLETLVTLQDSSPVECAADGYLQPVFYHSGQDDSQSSFSPGKDSLSHFRGAVGGIVELPETCCSLSDQGNSLRANGGLNNRHSVARTRAQRQSGGPDVSRYSQDPCSSSTTQWHGAKGGKLNHQEEMSSLLFPLPPPPPPPPAPCQPVIEEDYLWPISTAASRKGTQPGQDAIDNVLYFQSPPNSADVSHNKLNRAEASKIRINESSTDWPTQFLTPMAAEQNYDRKDGTILCAADAKRPNGSGIHQTYYNDM